MNDIMQILIPLSLRSFSKFVKYRPTNPENMKIVNACQTGNRGNDIFFFYLDAWVRRVILLRQIRVYLSSGIMNLKTMPWPNFIVNTVYHSKSKQLYFTISNKSPISKKKSKSTYKYVIYIA